MEREQLIQAVKQIAWGYILLHININLGSLNILPNWLGYVLMLQALPVLAEHEPSALLLRPLGIMLAIWEGVVWGATVFGITIDSTILMAIGTTISLYFHFQLLTNLASLAEKYDCPEQTRILRLRTVRTVLITLMALPFSWEQHVPIIVGVSLVHIIVTIWICSVLFSLRSSLVLDCSESSLE